MPNTTRISPGARGADFVGPTAAIDDWLDANDAQFVVRYFAGGGTWKHITPAEIAHHHARGIAILLNFEGSTLDYTGGAARGTLYGVKARLEAERLGYPLELPIIVSVDTGLLSTQLPIAAAYVLAFFSAARPYRPGLYGPVNLYHKVEHLAPTYWLPNASSWQTGLRADDVVHVKQMRSLHPPGIDPNIAVVDFAAWLPTVAPTPAPSPTLPPEDDMRIIIEDQRLGGAAYYADTLKPVGPAVVEAARADTVGHRIVQQDHEPTTLAFVGGLDGNTAVWYERFRDSRDNVAD